VYTIEVQPGENIHDLRFLWADFSRYWVGSWSVICLACCTFTLLSFLIDVSRFAYPERPIIYLGACFAMIAVALVVGFAVGDDIACDDEAGSEVKWKTKFSFLLSSLKFMN